VNGLEDLKKKRIVFIGYPVQRILEDYLRILRFFRFYAEYGQNTVYDQKSLEACIAEKRGLHFLSKERITSEFLKIIEAENAVSVLMLMEKTGILSEILPFTCDIGLDEFILGELYKPDKISPLRILSFLSVYFKIMSDEFLPYLRLSKKILTSVQKIKEFYDFLSCYKVIPLISDPVHKDFLKEALFLCCLLIPEKNIIWKNYLYQIEDVSFIFPLSGKVLINAGYKSGQKMGFLLEKGKLFWYLNDFKSTQENILQFLLKEYPPSVYFIDF
jgi:poly(A) polymerase